MQDYLWHNTVLKLLTLLVAPLICEGIPGQRLSVYVTEAAEGVKFDPQVAPIRGRQRARLGCFRCTSSSLLLQRLVWVWFCVQMSETFWTVEQRSKRSKRTDLSVFGHSSVRRTHTALNMSARVPLLCLRCSLLFFSQPSGIEKVGALICLPLIPTMHLGATLAHLEACVCVFVCVRVSLCETA